MKVKIMDKNHNGAFNDEYQPQQVIGGIFGIDLKISEILTFQICDRENVG